MTSLVLFAVLIGLIIVRIPIAIALGFTCVFGLSVYGNFDLEVMVARMFAANNSFALLAVPFFILAGEIMVCGGISRKLVRFAGSLVNHFQGGLGAVAILSSAFFAAISGSNAATVAAIGSVMIPDMREKGYSARYTAALVAAAGVTGMIIPPSILMILYGVVTGVSITDLFIAGFIPGIFISLTLMLLNWLWCKRQPVERDYFKGFGDVYTSFKEAIWALMMPVVILGGIYGGIFTPTEAAAVAVLYGLLVGFFAYKELTLRSLYKALLKATVSTAIVMLIMNFAGAFTWMITVERIPQTVAASLAAISGSQTIFIILVDVLLLIVGCFMNAAAAITVFSAILYPAAMAFGVNPVLFGVIMCVNLSIGTVTPPLGVDLFIASTITGIPLEAIVTKLWPFILMLFVDVFIISLYAPLAMTLVHLIG